MRAPGEAPGMMALEVAMDEMAEKLGLDPVEFRIRNDTQVDPEQPKRKFSTAPAHRMPARPAPSDSAGPPASRSRSRFATGDGWSGSAWPRPIAARRW
jgi:xanthine dehydrogenase YagR molybdenum-binding subunit